MQAFNFSVILFVLVVSGACAGSERPTGQLTSETTKGGGGAAAQTQSSPVSAADQKKSPEALPLGAAKAQQATQILNKWKNKVLTVRFPESTAALTGESSLCFEFGEFSRTKISVKSHSSGQVTVLSSSATCAVYEYQAMTDDSGFPAGSVVLFLRCSGKELKDSFASRITGDEREFTNSKKENRYVVSSSCNF